jgi:hypothetical protein
MIIAPASSIGKIYPFFTKDGKKSWIHVPGDKYVVTGVDCSGKRFSIWTENWLYAKGINVYNGTRWLLRGGKRWKIESVTN